MVHDAVLGLPAPARVAQGAPLGTSWRPNTRVDRACLDMVPHCCAFSGVSTPANRILTYRLPTTNIVSMSPSAMATTQSVMISVVAVAVQAGAVSRRATRKLAQNQQWTRLLGCSFTEARPVSRCIGSRATSHQQVLPLAVQRWLARPPQLSLWLCPRAPRRRTASVLLLTSPNVTM